MMPHERLCHSLATLLTEMADEGRMKGAESVITGIAPPARGRGPRYFLADADAPADAPGNEDAPFLRMNSNSYLGLGRDPDVIAAGETAVRAFGAGPGAVRFISGTWSPHIALERKLAAFHGREAAMAFSSAYATVLGVLVPLITPETVVISDALNHNCIINALRLARPGQKHVYDHLEVGELDAILGRSAGPWRRAIIVTDGVFSMRGDHAPLSDIMAIARRHDDSFPENVLVMVDDSHGVGAFGATGRGTEEVTGLNSAGDGADILVGTLGKAFGVNGGYVAGSRVLIDYLRQTAPLYIYSNPVSPGEAAATTRAIAMIDEPRGRDLLRHLADMTARFKAGLAALNLETIAGPHPIAPLMIRDTSRTAKLAAGLRANHILATGLNYPVVPKGDESIRFQISAEHTEADINEVLDVLGRLAARDS